MANMIELANINASNFVPAGSRYLNSDVIYYYKDDDDYKKITYKTYKKGQVVESDTDRFGLITPGVEYRPDLVSFKAYGTVDLWWRIMEINNIKDVYDFKAGLTIRIPSRII